MPDRVRAGLCSYLLMCAQSKLGVAMPKILILRGNSGSGKSSVARAIQDKVNPAPILIEHDHFRRKILKESEGPNSINAGLIYRTVEYALENNRDVIIEGIMRMKYYEPLFEKLKQLNPHQTYFYYFDISFDETVRRHATKAGVDFGEAELRQWFKADDYSHSDNEILIPETNTLEATITAIIKQTGLRPLPVSIQDSHLDPHNT